MKIVNDEPTDKIVKSAIEQINHEMNKFRILHAETIGELIRQQRFDDLCTVMYKQGFLTGMKFKV